MASTMVRHADLLGVKTFCNACTPLMFIVGADGCADENVGVAAMLAVLLFPQ